MAYSSFPFQSSCNSGQLHTRRLCPLNDGMKKDRNCCCPVYHGHQEISCLLASEPRPMGWQTGKGLCSWLSHWSAPSTLLYSSVNQLAWQPCYSKSVQGLAPSAPPSKVQNEEPSPIPVYQICMLTRSPADSDGHLSLRSPGIQGAPFTHRHIFFLWLWDMIKQKLYTHWDIS